MFNVGDRVVAVIDCNGNIIPAGTTGTICHVVMGSDANVSWYGVRWDISPDRDMLHDCAGHCEPGLGWYVFPEDIELCEAEASERNFDCAGFEFLFDMEVTV